MAKGTGSGRPVLRVITPNASPEEVAAIVAAVTAIASARLEASAVAPAAGASRWLSASRLSARRAGLARGEWRLSGRIGCRARA